MRLLSKLKIFFRLKKEEIIDGVKEYGLGTLVLISIPFIMALIVWGIGALVGIIAVQFYTIQEWAVILDMNRMNSFLDVGFTLFLLGWFILGGIALVGVILFLLGKWVYSNWQMAERELTRLENKLRIKK